MTREIESRDYQGEPIRLMEHVELKGRARRRSTLYRARVYWLRSDGARSMDFDCPTHARWWAEEGMLAFVVPRSL